MTGRPLRDQVMELPDTRQLSWCEYGDPGGRPVVYCHGLPGSRLELSPHGGAAAEGGMRLLVPDRPGYGRSSPRPGRRLGEEAADVAVLADRLGLGAFDVLGFSGGGPHALAIAARLPDRVQRAGLISSLAPLDRAGTAGMAEANRQLWELARADPAAFTEAVEQAVAAAGSAYDLLVGGAPEEDRAIFADEALAGAYRRDLEEALRQGVAGMREDAGAVTADWPFAVGDLRCPVRLWHGDRDANAPIGMGRWLAEHLPRAELTEWPGAAHFAFFRHWGEVLDGLAPA